jgi:3-hydroxyisobutyrate dehydrogenase-like beta-hydroxyacid dehydrogenase
MELGWIGTGLMGRPMAERLLAAGHRLTVWNRTREKALPLVERGARVVEDPSEALESSEATITMLADARAIHQALFGAGRRPDLAGRTLIQASTIGPDESLGLADAVTELGGEYLEAPVLGSTPQAREGSLLVMVGATAEQLERWRPVLAAWGPEPVHVGGVAQVAVLKLALNHLIAAQAVAFSLSLGMVRRQGIEVDVFMGILRQAGFYARSFDAKLPRMLERDFDHPNFPAALMLKDLDLVRAEASRLGLEPAALEGLREVVARAAAAGLGRADYSVVYDIVDPPEATPGRR